MQTAVGFVYSSQLAANRKHGAAAGGLRQRVLSLHTAHMIQSSTGQLAIPQEELELEELVKWYLGTAAEHGADISNSLSSLEVLPLVFETKLKCQGPFKHTGQTAVRP